MNIKNIINEVIAQTYDDNRYDLATAQKHYGNLVPWTLDTNDLNVIKHMRNLYFQEKNKLNNYDSNNEKILSDI